MPTMKKVLVSLPDELLDNLDALAAEEGMTRSEVVRLSLKQTIAARHKLKMSEALRQGYEAMASINREWAEMGIAQDLSVLSAYEHQLSERETE